MTLNCPGEWHHREQVRGGGGLYGVHPPARTHTDSVVHSGCGLCEHLLGGQDGLEAVFITALSW